MVTCRRAGIHDEAAISRMMRDFYAEERLAYSEHCAAALRALLAGRALGDVYLIEMAGAETEGVGYFVLTWCYSLERGGRIALLDELYVIAEARGRGAGKQAIATAVEAARSAGCGTMVLEVDQVNERARRLYLKAGFEALGREGLSMTIE